MRRSHWGFTATVAVLFCFSALSLTGCKSGGGYTMSDWGWGNKKAADTATAASSPTAGLPAPPSSTATPNGVPSYAGNTGTAGQSAAWSSASSQGAPVSSAAPYAATGDYARKSGATQGLYSRDYQSTGQASPGGYGQKQSPDSRPAGGYAGTAASNAYGVPAQTASTGNRAVGGDAYGSYGNTGTSGAQTLAPYSPAPAGLAGSTYGAGGYGSGTANANAYTASADTAQNMYGAAPTSGGNVYGQGDVQQGALTSSAPASVAEPFLPGSTGRSTQYSDHVTAPGSESVQPAAFAVGGNAPDSGYPATTAPDTTYGGSTYSAPRTATGTGPAPPYNNTFQR